MSESRISTEYSARVYDDDHGWFVSVGPDPDGLDLCRIAYSEEGAKDREFTIPWKHAEALACAIFDLAPLKEKHSAPPQQAASAAANPNTATPKVLP